MIAVQSQTDSLVAGLAGALGAAAESDPHAGKLLERVASAVEENARLADEVLLSYEQLNLIFDLTVELAGVNDCPEIERRLFRRVGPLLRGEAICLVRANHAVDWLRIVPSGASQVTASLDADALRVRAERVRAQRRVVVAALRDRQVICGPLVRLDDRVDVAFVVRAAGAASFTSGDMLMLESALSFGGRMISNTEAYQRIGRMSLEVTRALVAAIDHKDRYTRGHSERVAMLSRCIGEQLGLSNEEQQTLEWAGLLHDIGKIGVPETILQKPGALTPEEFDVIKRHPRMGFEILRPITSFDRVLEAVLHHHEQPDGRGYPDGLKNTEVPLHARIVHVADVFDALTSTRSYRGAFPFEKAVQIIRNDAGTKLDATVAAAFIDVAAELARTQPEMFDHIFAQPMEASHVATQ
ncbi:MAG: HD-GYP domain-containing protein [Phycisphaerae bacterium]